MEFYCVLSVGGSLATYKVIKEGELKYSAVFTATNGKREDVPQEIKLEKDGSNWLAQPWHDEIVKALLYAIDSTYQEGREQE